jgi:hypothetical protein
MNVSLLGHNDLVATRLLQSLVLRDVTIWWQPDRYKGQSIARL